MTRESMPIDVAIVGAGLAGLAAAIHLKQLTPGLEKGSPRRIVMLDLAEPNGRSQKAVRRKETNWGYRWGNFAPHRKIKRVKAV